MFFNPLNHPVCLSPVQWLQPSTWAQHVPFGMYLIDILRPNMFVELGTYYGVSYCGFCQAVQELQLSTKCYAIDTWRGDPQSGFMGDEVLHTLKPYHDDLYAGFSRLIQSTFDEALNSFGDESIDLLHIDGYHTYESVKHDFESWLPKMTSRGVILFHDINVHQGDFGVWKFWGETKDHYPYFEFDHGNGLGIIAVGDDTPQAFIELTETSSEEQKQIRQYFVQAGMLVDTRINQKYLSGEVQTLSSIRESNLAEIQQLAQQNQGLLGEISGLADLREKHLAEIDRLLGVVNSLNTQQANLSTEVESLRTANSILTKQRDEANITLNNQVEDLVAAEKQIVILEEQLNKTQNALVQLETTFAQLGKHIESSNRASSAVELPTTETDTQQNKLPDLPLDSLFLTEIAPKKQSDNLETIHNFMTPYEKMVSIDHLEPGEYELLVRVVDELGHSRVASQQITIKSHSISMYIDAPTEQIVSMGYGRLNIRGWAYSTAAPVECIQVYVNETYLGNLPYGKVREDVASVYDDPKMLHCGFEGKLNYDALSPGDYNIIIKAVDALGDQYASVHPLSVIDEDVAKDDVRVSRSMAVLNGVSIVIPVFNALDYTRACIESIYKARNRVPFEVIVVNNGSQDGTREWLDSAAEQYPNFYRAHLEDNMGFAKGVNLGLQNARGRHIVILNNDTLVTSHWLDHLVEAAESDDALGIVSPMTNYVGEGPQVDPEAIDLAPHMAERFASGIRRRKELQIVPDRLVFFCVLVKRSLVDLLGGLDEGFLKGNYEDDDFCLRARISGYKLAIARNAFVYHHGSRTFNTNKLRHNQWMLRNRIHYLEKMTRLATTPPTHAPVPRVGQGPVNISVVVRTRNRPEALKLALTSLANQTYKDFEVVLVNDGGVDVSNMVEHFQAYYPINYIFHEVGKGRTPALNAGVSATSGRFITYLDDDDVVYPQHLEVLWDAIRQNGEPGKFAYSNFNHVLVTNYGADGVVLARIPQEPWRYNRDELLVQNYIPIHTWLHDRDCIDGVGLFNEKLDSLEDWDFLLRVAHQYDFLSSPRITCEYRFYQGGTNSIVRQRSTALSSLEYIYECYPVGLATLNYARELQLQANRELVDKIAEVEAKLLAEPEKESEYLSDILNKVVNFDDNRV